jgi:hypothetical protein
MFNKTSSSINHFVAGVFKALLKKAAVATAAIGIMTSSAPAWAGNLYTGTGYQNGGLSISLHGGPVHNEAGGSIGIYDHPTYDGLELPFLYCVEIETNINVPGTYDTNVTRNGVVHGGLINNAGQIAWLIDNIAPLATSHDDQLGLQAAIWQQVYGSDFVVDQSQTSAGIFSAYTADLTALGSNTAAVDHVAWLSPYNGQGQISAAQGMVTAGWPLPPGPSTVPEPSTLGLFGLGALGLAIKAIRRRQRQPAASAEQA